MNSFHHLWYLNSSVLAMIPFATSGITAKDILTFHPAKGTSTWWSFNWTVWLRLWLSFTKDRVHYKTTQTSTVDYRLKFIFCRGYSHFGESSLIKLESFASHILSGRVKFDLVFLYLCDSFFHLLIIVHIGNYVSIFIIDTTCGNDLTVFLGSQLIIIIFLSFKYSKIIIILLFSY